MMHRPVFAVRPFRLLALFSYSFVATLLFVLISAVTAHADEKRHAVSLIGTPKYPADFKHFDYVNPNAPKGGKIHLGAYGTFDNFNIVTFKGNLANGIMMIYDQLMVSSMDEASTEYGQLAEWVSYPADYSSATYKLRSDARWHDGKPVTPEDVIFSLGAFKSLDNNPQYALYYKNVSRAEKTGDNQVTFFFDMKNNRELPQIVGQLYILPKHYYEGNGSDGKKHDPSKTTLDVPLGSGPYKIKSFEAGRFVTFERVKDYWGEKIPTSIGQNNFDEIQYDYYRDQEVLFQAFSSGRTDFFLETSAKNWATRYDFPAVKAGRVIKDDSIELKLPQPMQAFIMNTRLQRFADPRVRQAFNLAMNFEWLNDNIFYGKYRRVSSYFENTELASRGLPEGKELEILNDLRSEIPPEVFTTAYTNPINDTPEKQRSNLLKAGELLTQAGWEVKDGVLKHSKTGEVFTAEFLLANPAFTRVTDSYIQALQQLGIQASARLVDDTQFQYRMQNFKFEIVVGGFRQSESPGNEQREYWSSAAADRAGSRNFIGIKNPAVDKLIDRIIFAKDRAELVAASRALDRVLLWNHYCVPQWYMPAERFAYWNRFSHPEPLPNRSLGFPYIWWYDEAKAAKTGAQ